MGDGRILEVGAVNVPAAEQEVAVRGEPRNGEARERQSVQQVRAAPDQLRPGRHRRGDGATHADNGDA